MTEEELHSPNAGTGQGTGNLLCHVLRFFQMGRVNIGGLEAFPVVSIFLHMADGRTEQSGAILLGHRKQGYLAIELDEFFHNQLLDITPAATTPVLPGVFQLIRSLHDGLALARRRHQRLHHARESDLGGSVLQFVQRLGIEITGRLQAQFLGGQVANGFTVHGEVDSPRAGYHLDAFLLEFIEPFGTDGLYLGHNEIGLMLTHRTLQGVPIQHAEHFTLVRHLHGGRTGIRIAGNDILSQTLGGNHKLLAQFAGT